MAWPCRNESLGGASVIDRTKYNWTATKIEACIKFDFDIGEPPVAMAKQVLETDTFFNEASRCLSEHSVEWIEAIGMASDNALRELSNGEVGAELHGFVIGLVYIAAATSVVRGHLGVPQAIRWGDLQLAKYGVFPDLDPDFDVSELVEMLDNPEDPDTKELMARVEERMARADKKDAELPAPSRGGGRGEAGESLPQTSAADVLRALLRLLKELLKWAAGLSALAAVVALVVGFLNLKSKQEEESRERQRIEAISERVRTLGTTTQEYEYVDGRKGEVDRLQRMSIEIDGLQYFLYRRVLSGSRIVAALPRVGHFTAYAFWKTECQVGTRMVTEGSYWEKNVIEGRGSKPDQAELTCVEKAGDTWLMRYAVWGSADSPYGWEEDYGGFKVDVRFAPDSNGRGGWAMKRGLQAATLNSASVKDTGFPVSICAENCGHF